ncbi:Aste57867_22693 [Aphanomyces stellatus]|uniref:Aste57867_22693 protein n=1 Tax=Aphanomyces stellatus TaxID=120398 RepID=A0A485LME4_9STRA|nr:hypothetical protein As57867_022623 [Aphanomyces stellatus]VFT99347.1 Aste57867_22693 [Aphanomyces stellatus]
MRRYPSVVGFVNHNKDTLPGFSIDYVRGKPPTLQFFDGANELQSSVNIATWNQESIQAYVDHYLKPSEEAARAFLDAKAAMRVAKEEAAEAMRVAAMEEAKKKGEETAAQTSHGSDEL